MSTQPVINGDPVFMYGCADPVKVVIPCTECRVNQEVVVGKGDYLEFAAGSSRTVNEIFEYLANPEREMFLTGTCRRCWKKMYGAEDTSREYVDAFAEGKADAEWIDRHNKGEVERDDARVQAVTQRYLAVYGLPHTTSAQAGYRDGWEEYAASRPVPPNQVAEHALYDYRDGKDGLEPLTAEQRAWCVSEADSSGEGYYSREELEKMTDAELAGAVLDAWKQYVDSHF